MKYALLLCAIVVVVYVGYESVRMYKLVRISSRLVQESRAYQRAEGTVRVLVLGDSTAVGVGSDSSESVAGRMAQRLDASVENYAVSGAKTRDVSAQFAHKKRDRYDLVLVQVGANDIIRFSEIDALRDEIANVLHDATSVSERVVLITAGKVGEAPFFPRALAWLWTNRAATVRTHFTAAAQESGAAYVDLYAAENTFASDPERYYAPDGLHLKGDGYGFWYDQSIRVIEARWPELAYEKRSD